MTGILMLENMNRGNTLKQGDKTPLTYKLLDADGDNLNIAGKTATARLVHPNYLTIGYEKSGLTVSQDDTVTFTIDKLIPARKYNVEIIVDNKFVFPSRSAESNFTIDKSSLGNDARIIEIIGKEALIRTVKTQVDTELQPLITSMESAQQAELERVQAENERSVKYESYAQQFNDVITDLSEEKDYHSLPEISAARGGYDTLGQRLDETTAQLAHKADESEIILARDGEETLQKRLLRDSNTIQTIGDNLDAFANKINFKRISVLDFGAVGDGVTDDTQAFLDAIAYAESIKVDDGLNRFLQGVKIDIPTGVFYITQELIIKKSHIYIEGAGFSSTVIYRPDATRNGITFDGSEKAIYGSGLSNLRVYSPGNSTSGVAVRFINIINSINVNVQISGAYEGLEIDGGGKLYFNQWIIDQTNRTTDTSPSYQLKILGNHGLPGDIHFTDLQVVPKYLSLDYSVLIRASDGLYFTNAHIHAGVLIEPRGVNSESTLASIFFTNTYFDNSRKELVKFAGTSAAYRNFFLNNCYMRGGVNGVVVAPTSDISILLIKACKISGMTQHGIRIDVANASDFSFSDIIFADNNTSNLVDGTDILVRGNGHIITNTQHSNSSTRVGYSINLGTATSNCLVDNILSANSKIVSSAKVLNNGTNNIVGRLVPAQS